MSEVDSAGPVLERRAQRREGLLDAAEQAVRVHGAEVSMEVISAEAGITKPIL